MCSFQMLCGWMKRDGSRESELGTVRCARIYTQTSTPRSPEASISAKFASLSKQNDQDSDLSSDSTEKEAQVPNKKRRKWPEDGHSESPEETAVKGRSVVEKQLGWRPR